MNVVRGPAQGALDARPLTVSAEPPQVSSWRRLATSWLGPAISLVAVAAVVAWALQQEAPSFPTDAGSLGLLALAVALEAVEVSGGEAVSFTMVLRFVLIVPIMALALALLASRYGGLRVSSGRPVGG